MAVVSAAEPRRGVDQSPSATHTTVRTDARHSGYLDDLADGAPWRQPAAGDQPARAGGPPTGGSQAEKQRPPGGARAPPHKTKNVRRSSTTSRELYTTSCICMRTTSSVWRGSEPAASLNTFRKSGAFCTADRVAHPTKTAADGRVERTQRRETASGKRERKRQKKEAAWWEAQVSSCERVGTRAVGGSSGSQQGRRVPPPRGATRPRHHRVAASPPQGAPVRRTVGNQNTPAAASAHCD